MAKYRITTKLRLNSAGMTIEKGMSVEMVTLAPNLMCGQAGDQLNQIFKATYGVDLKAMHAQNTGFLKVERIG